MEPQVSDKFCKLCVAWKPGTEFYAKSGRRCKACVIAQTYARRGTKPKPPEVDDEVPGWPIPRDGRGLHDQLLDCTQRRMRLVVNPGHLRPMLLTTLPLAA